jgi:hypothetical protein
MTLSRLQIKMLMQTSNLTCDFISTDLKKRFRYLDKCYGITNHCTKCFYRLYKLLHYGAILQGNSEQ